MREGKIAAPSITFDHRTNAIGRMWADDDVQSALNALKAIKPKIPQPAAMKVPAPVSPPMFPELQQH
jgi:hypothetical protein